MPIKNTYFLSCKLLDDFAALKEEIQAIPTNPSTDKWIFIFSQKLCYAVNLFWWEGVRQTPEACMCYLKLLFQDSHLRSDAKRGSTEKFQSGSNFLH